MASRPPKMHWRPKTFKGPACGSGKGGAMTTRSKDGVTCGRCAGILRTIERMAAQGWVRL